MNQGHLRPFPTALFAAVTKALLCSGADVWFQGDHLMVDDGRTVWLFEVPLGIHTNKRKLAYHPGPFIRFTKNGVQILGTLLRYRKPWADSKEAVPYCPAPTESKYGVGKRVQLLAETLAKLGRTNAEIHDLVDKNTYEPSSLMEAANLDETVGAINEAILEEHDNNALSRMRQDALPKYQNQIRFK